MRYWKQFAKMLGLELEEEFFLIKPNGKRVNDEVHKFAEDGMYYKETTTQTWHGDPSSTLWLILSEAYKAVPKPWKPKEGDRYCYYSAMNGLVNYARWDDLDIELIFWKVGNCFKTEEEAKTKGKELMKTIKKEYEEA